jgi:acyl-CoA synthetase (AMP-forming)/AMP-acid ligase II
MQSAVLTTANPEQKGVMISHRNVIANVLQFTTFEKKFRAARPGEGGKEYLDVALGLLPQSHIYALVVVCHSSVYRGDQVISLPRFELRSYLNAIQRFRINTLYLVSNQPLLGSPAPPASPHVYFLHICWEGQLILSQGPTNHHSHDE